MGRSFAEQQAQAQDEMLAQLPQGPTLNGRALFRSYEGECGMCVACHEWCEVGASCCGRGVIFEGGFVADFEEDEE